jgi:hypothetical protein
MSLGKLGWLSNFFAFSNAGNGLSVACRCGLYRRPAAIWRIGPIAAARSNSGARVDGTADRDAACAIELVARSTPFEKFVR